MKRSRKTLFVLLLALVMMLGLAATAWATGGTGSVEGVDPGNAGAWKSFEIPFTKTVELGGNTAPGETTFSLEITNFEELKEKCPNAEYKTVVTINNGAGRYNGKLIISGSENLVKGSLQSGFYVREKNDNQPGWKYSDEVWCVECTSDGSSFNFYPAEMKKTENEESYNKVENADAVDKMTFTNTYTEVAIPFTKTVRLGGNLAPGKTDFTIAVCHVNAHDLSDVKYKDVKYKATVTTTGAGDFGGTLIISGPGEQVAEFISEGFFVHEVKKDLSGWTYSNEVWFVSRNGEIYPAKMENGENGEVVFREDERAGTVDKMTFTNTYTYNYTSQRPAEKPNTPETAITAPKTFDAGVALYGVSALLSLTGTALVIKRKNG